MKRLCNIIALCFIATTSFALDLDKDSVIEMKSTQLGKLYKASNSSRVSVHDPSIVVYTNPTTKKSTYYIFGSHRACAVSIDLKNWSGQGWNYGYYSGKNVVSTSNFPNVFVTNQTKTVPVLSNPNDPSSEVVEATFGPFDTEKWRWTSNNGSLGGNQWAPDVIWNPTMKKWCMYMSLNGDSWRSSIALLTSDNVLGPYVYQGPVVYSGFQWGEPAGQTYKETDLELVLGKLDAVPSRYAVGGSWGRRWPNNIDPCVFFDEEGEMWMCYGSWSGGIFILRLNKENGLRDYTYTYKGVNNNTDGVTSDPYFGKKIAGGYYVSGEGAYVEHIGNYYYLFVTNGGLEAAKGYEMHYFRSKNPDGPYIDASGGSAIYSRYEMNYGTTAPHTYGMKILGSFKWDNMNLAEMSQGHNSVKLDDDGRAYLIYHTRFNSGNEGFEDRVHQIFLNQKGWLVASPHEFSGINGKYCNYTQTDIDSTEICTVNDIVGTYQIMSHPYKVDFANMAYSAPQTVYFKASGAISGDYSGTWRRVAGTSYITLRIRTRGSSTYTEYYGVILPQLVGLTNMPSVCFTAIAQNGVSLWGCNVDGDYAVDYNYSNCITLPFTARQIIKSDIDLTQKNLKYGASVEWSSSHPDLISDKGKLKVQTYDDGDTTVVVNFSYAVVKDNYKTTHKRAVRIKTMKSLLPIDEDVNRDGVVNSLDVLKVYKFMQTSTGTESNPIEDVNRDGVVNSLDVLKIYKYMQSH